VVWSVSWKTWTDQTICDSSELVSYEPYINGLESVGNETVFKERT